MPFLNQIIDFINLELKGGSLNKQKLQPAVFHGIASTVSRSKKGNKDAAQLENLPALITGDGSVKFITPDDKLALQIYHRLLSKAYSLEKKGYGDDHFTKTISEINMVLIANSKITGKAIHALEPVVLFGLPQKLSPQLVAELKVQNCLITPLGANTDSLAVFRSEYPQSPVFLNERLQMFSFRYRIETTFSRSCIEQCLCEDS